MVKHGICLCRPEPETDMETYGDFVRLHDLPKLAMLQVPQTQFYAQVSFLNFAP